MKQRKLELGHVERPQPIMKAVGHRLIRVLLETIVNFSKKHGALYQVLIDIKAGVAPTTLDTEKARASTRDVGR